MHSHQKHPLTLPSLLSMEPLSRADSFALTPPFLINLLLSSYSPPFPSYHNALLSLSFLYFFLQCHKQSLLSPLENKRAALTEKLEQLRSVTNSDAISNTSIILDASRYIEKLKQKVEKLNVDVATAQSSSDQNPLPTVTVETVEKGFLINVFSEKSCSGLLVSILEAFEELGLNVLEARVSCVDNFRLEAVGGENEGQVSVDAEEVKQAVLQAIKNWSENSEQEQ